MLNSFKDRILKTIEQLQNQKNTIIQSLNQQSYQQLSQSLTQYSDSKSIRTLLSVLQSDFNMQNENITSLFEKIKQIKQQLNRQSNTTSTVQNIPLKLNTLQVQSHSRQHQTTLQQDDNEFLKEEIDNNYQANPTTIQLITSSQKTPVKILQRKSKINKQLLYKQKLKTDVDTKGTSILANKYTTQTNQQQHYYSQQKIPQWRYIEDIQNQWEKIFNIYHKMPLGILKEKSFEERSLSYKTMNYQKILAFMNDLNINPSADCRLSVIKIMRKHSLNHKLITKNQFKDVYQDLCTNNNINPENVQNLLRQKQTASSNTRQLPYRRIVSVGRTAQAMSKKGSNQKARSRRAIIIPLEKEKVQRTYASNAAQKLKIKQLTWQILFNISDASVFTNVHVPPMDLNRANEDEDSYYLQEFYSKRDDKKQSPIKQLLKSTKTKITLPLIRSRLTPLKEPRR